MKTRTPAPPSTLKVADGTGTEGSWKARCFSRGPIDGDMNNRRVENTSIPDNWFAVDFDDSDWKAAREYTAEAVGPKQAFYDADFKGRHSSGATT